MNSDSVAVKAKRISELDGWRGISIICVIAGHLLNNIGAQHGARVAGELAGWGVDIFFIISGFIIAKLAIHERQTHGWFSVSNFYCRRIFRILPAFYFYLFAVALLASNSVIKQDYLGVAVASVFTCNVANVVCGWFVGHSWSLAFEEQFYLTFPLLFYLSERYTRGILIAILGGLMALPLAGNAMHDQRAWWVASRFAPHFSFICIGVVAAFYEAAVRRLAASGRSLLISVADAALLLALLVSNACAPILSGALADALPDLNAVLLPPCLAWIVFTLIYWKGPASGILRSRPIQFIGLISYSLYLWQEFFTATPENYLKRGWWCMPPLMIVAATLSFYCIERPFIHIGKRFLGGQHGTPPPPRLAHVPARGSTQGVP